MILENYFWKYESVIPIRFCNDIIKLALTNKNNVHIGLTGGAKLDTLTREQEKEVKKIRNSNVAWLNDKWIYNLIHPFIKDANKNAKWNFDWETSEPCQFTIYEEGQYYDWHCDTHPKLYTDGNLRKLSVTLSLSDPSEYEGGELEFDFRDNAPHEKANTYVCKEILSKGSLVVFPSSVWHRVRPVKKGKRYSLVVWNLGKPFK